jgi:DNA-binding GntR family transcriptional regulator
MIRDKAIPFYYQLETILRKKIIPGDFVPDTPLHGEEMLVANYQVSRATVRQALSALEKENYVVRQSAVRGLLYQTRSINLICQSFSVQ